MNLLNFYNLSGSFLYFNSNTFNNSLYYNFSNPKSFSNNDLSSQFSLPSFVCSYYYSNSNYFYFSYSILSVYSKHFYYNLINAYDGNDQ